MIRIHGGWDLDPQVKRDTIRKERYAAKGEPERELREWGVYDPQPTPDDDIEADLRWADTWYRENHLEQWADWLRTQAVPA